MGVAVVGTGNMARAIAMRLVSAGPKVALRGTTREESEPLARELLKQRAHDVTAGVSGDEIAGDDEDAKRTVTPLIEDADLCALGCGPLQRAHFLEGLGCLHGTIQDAPGTAFSSAITISL